MDADFFITNVTSRMGVLVDGAFSDSEVFLEGEVGQLATIISKARVRGIVGW